MYATISLLLVCKWRHGGHVGGQEQKHFSPLGNELYFDAHLSEKFLLYWPPTWPPCHVVANQESIYTNSDHEKNESDRELHAELMYGAVRKSWCALYNLNVSTSVNLTITRFYRCYCSWAEAFYAKGPSVKIHTTVIIWQLSEVYFIFKVKEWLYTCLGSSIFILTPHPPAGNTATTSKHNSSILSSPSSHNTG